jgi:16S rRNA (uracil1498-N3)-methyltransferase
MRQLFLPFDYKDQELVRVEGQSFHYLSTVLRLKPGDSFQGRNKTGELFMLTITEKEKTALILKAEQMPEQTPDQGFKLNLYQSLPKGPKIDLIIRQATEAGISRIIPFISAHTVPHSLAGKSKEERVEKKLARWERIAQEAVQQSGSLNPPLLETPLSFKEVLTRIEAGLSLFFHQDPLNDLTLHHYLHNRPDSVNLIIGPEGGFSTAEVKDLLAAGAKAVFLGNTVLRVETAALFAIASVKIILMEQKSWKLKS